MDEFTRQLGIRTWIQLAVSVSDKMIFELGSCNDDFIKHSYDVVSKNVTGVLAQLVKAIKKHFQCSSFGDSSIGQLVDRIHY